MIDHVHLIAPRWYHRRRRSVEDKNAVVPPEDDRVSERLYLPSRSAPRWRHRWSWNWWNVDEGDIGVGSTYIKVYPRLPMHHVGADDGVGATEAATKKLLEKVNDDRRSRRTGDWYGRV